MNALRTMFLLVGLTGLLLAIGSLLGGTNGMTIMFVVSIITNLVSYWFSDRIVLSMYGAKQVTAQDAPELIRVLSGLAQKAKVPTPKLYVIDADIPNAFATGRNPNNAAIAVTTEILKALEAVELEAVLAHELAHIKNRDTLIGTVVAIIAGVITMVAHILQWSILLLSAGKNNEKAVPSKLTTMAEIAVMILVAPLAATFIQFGISRAREFKADETGSLITGNPLALARALRKIEESARHHIMPEASPTSSHMFIVNPFSGTGNWLMNLFSTHPETEQRIEYLIQLSNRK
jgi:heat shock protein HtpX